MEQGYDVEVKEAVQLSERASHGSDTANLSTNPPSRVVGLNSHGCTKIYGALASIICTASLVVVRRPLELRASHLSEDPSCKLTFDVDRSRVNGCLWPLPQTEREPSTASLRLDEDNHESLRKTTNQGRIQLRPRQAVSKTKAIPPTKSTVCTVLLIRGAAFEVSTIVDVNSRCENCVWTVR